MEEGDVLCLNPLSSGAITSGKTNYLQPQGEQNESQSPFKRGDYFRIEGDVLFNHPALASLNPLSSGAITSG
ncbi:hypothetical protein CCP3SC15_170007 [Gammaproteobacteria bacterium]